MIINRKKSGSENYDDNRFCSSCSFAVQNEPLSPKQIKNIPKGPKERNLKPYAIIDVMKNVQYRSLK